MRLVVEGITVKLDSTFNLENVSFVVKQGELVCLLGPNGSGKTTLLRTLYGILKPVGGAVYIDFERCKNASSEGRKPINIHKMSIDEVAKVMGYLPQEYEDSNLTVFDVVLLGRTPYLSFRPSQRDIEMAKKALKITGMDKFQNKPFSRLSGGEKQKVMLSRIFCQQSEVLLLDEPTSHLDIKSQIEVMKVIERMCKAGKTAIVSLHDVNLATMFCDRVIMMKSGKIVYAGKTESVITSESIKDVFGINAEIIRRNGRIFVLPERDEVLD
jgi:iron complex transport system ATP-binding protein